MASYDLALAAEEDLQGIWLYTYEQWGLEQAETYFDRIEACCVAIGTGRARSRTLDGLPNGIRFLRCEQHYIFWLEGDRPIILAVLHKRMDLLRRLQNRLP